MIVTHIADYAKGTAEGEIGKIEIFLEQREVAFLSPSKIDENLNFSTVHL